MPTREPTILVVDDDAQIRTFVARQLKNEGYNVELARTGDEALERAAELIPDLIVLDVNMPEMDGLEACRRLKQDPLTNEIPVIFITGKTEEEDEARGFEVGAVDYIPKPFNPVIVKARVQTHARLKRQSDLLKALAYRDGLTGIPNRRRFEEWAAQELQRCDRLQAMVAGIMIDIDHFKRVNDSHGHPAGDAVLVEIHRRIRALVRDHDMEIGRAHV